MYSDKIVNRINWPNSLNLDQSVPEEQSVLEYVVYHFNNIYLLFRAHALNYFFL